MLGEETIERGGEKTETRSGPLRHRGERGGDERQQVLSDLNRQRVQALSDLNRQKQVLSDSNRQTMEAADIEVQRQRAIAFEDWEELYFWDDAMVRLEARMKVKEEEYIGAKVKVVTELRVAQVEKIGAKEVEEPQIDKVEVEVAAAKDDFWQGGRALDPGEVDQSDTKGVLEVGTEVELQVPAFEVEEPRIYKVERESLDTKGVLEVGAEVELQVPEFEVEEPRIYKVGRELLDTKDELVCRAAKDDFLQGGGAFDPGEGDCEIGIKEVEELLIGKVEVGGANKDEVVRSGGLDPGEDCVKSVEVKQVDVEVKQDLNGKLRGKFEETRAIKDDPGFRVIKNERQVDVEDVLGFCAAEDDSEFGAIKDEIEYCAAKDAEFELQRFASERLRFVTAGCRALGYNSEYG